MTHEERYKRRQAIIDKVKPLLEDIAREHGYLAIERAYHELKVMGEFQDTPRWIGMD